MREESRLDFCSDEDCDVTQSDSEKTMKPDGRGFAEVCGMWEKDRYKSLKLRNWKEEADTY